jgi:pSer/pThr/pTyr-binding forkhead associated (FHA) protein
MSNSRIPRSGEKPTFLILYIGLQRRPIRVAMKPEGIVVGRNSSDTFVDVDMTPYNGGEQGVSREHVVITPKRDHFVIKDLDTINSTWVNKRRLRPMVATDLYHGDIIHLAELRAEVHFAYDDDFIDNLDSQGSTKRLDASEIESPSPTSVSDESPQRSIFDTRIPEEPPQPPAFDTQIPEEQGFDATQSSDDSEKSPDTDELDLNPGVTKRFDD